MRSLRTQDGVAIARNRTLLGCWLTVELGKAAEIGVGVGVQRPGRRGVGAQQNDELELWQLLRAVREAESINSDEVLVD